MDKSAIQTIVIVLTVLGSFWLLFSGLQDNTKAITELRRDTGREIAELRRELRAEISANSAAIADLRSEISKMRVEINANSAAIAALRSEISEMRGAFYAHINGHSHLPQIAKGDGEKS